MSSRLESTGREDERQRLRIEDYGLVGNLRTATLVGRDGSVDWLCPPRFDSSACFSALLGDRQHGRWLLAPVGGVRPGDSMAPGGEAASLLRVVGGVRGSVRFGLGPGTAEREYDLDHGRMCGNFPQAFTHLALVGAAHQLAGAAPAGSGLSRPVSNNERSAA